MTIHIDDLADPELTEQQRSMRSLAEGFPVEFDPDLLTDAAAEQTGLHDFGSDDFLTRLSILCASVDQDDGLHATGRAGIWFDLVRYLSNRLRIHDVLERHPEIHDEVIDRPVIVAGLPRSGTTHLLNLMAADRRFRSMPYWESCEPVPVPGEASIVAGEDPRYTRCRKRWEQTDELLPLLKAMHAMTPDHVHEELEVMCPDIASYNFEWLFDAPAWREHYFTTDQTPHYAYMRTALKLVQWQDRQRGEAPGRWVLKCPQHLEQLPVLMATFPDATVAIPHRDPVSVVASAATMLSYGDRIRRHRTDPPRTFASWTDRIGQLLDRCLADRSAVPDAQSIDVRFHEFMADDLAMVERIYRVADIEMTAEARTDLAAYVRNHPRGLHGRVVADLEGDFGVTRAEVRPRFADYVNRFDIPWEDTP